MRKMEEKMFFDAESNTSTRLRPPLYLLPSLFLFLSSPIRHFTAQLPPSIFFCSVILPFSYFGHVTKAISNFLSPMNASDQSIFLDCDKSAKTSFVTEYLPLISAFVGGR